MKILFLTFLIFLEFECSELPNLSDECCKVGISYINHFKDQSTVLIPTFEDNLEKRENMIAPIIFLGSTAQYLSQKASKNKFRALSDKILSLADQNDPAFQKKLGIFIPRLLIFFKDINTLITHLIEKVQSQDDPVKIRGRCYSIVGMIRGLGVKKIDYYKVFDLINTIVRSQSLIYCS